MRIEQAFIHVDVDNLRTIFDLVARDLDSGFIVAGKDQFLNFALPVTLVRSPILTKREEEEREDIFCSTSKGGVRRP